jgi:hypothetical protein
LRRVFDIYDSFIPRTLGGLQPTVSSCRIYGWGGALLNHLNREVTVSPPSACDSNLPRIFCSSFSEQNDLTCAARLGAPLTCGDVSIIVGFLLDDRCVQREENFVLNYHSVEDFREWIEEVVSAAKTIQMSTLLILSAVFTVIKTYR